MTEAMVEPSNDEALWRFSLAFYARMGVPEALIALQDRAGCDVNLMLFALWLGVSGRSRLTKKGLEIADRIARPIRTSVVEPLRALRRRLKPDPDADVQRLREGIKALELAAEKVIQDRLGRTAQPPLCDTDPAARAAAAYANLALYLGPKMAGSSEAGTIAQALDLFVRG
ncbi:MAG: TIGR02444 family protein [Alphaproteobacteria bacterium]|nr:TIGR02444 family protein [Alphaproteobacteria bacterium]